MRTSPQVDITTDTTDNITLLQLPWQAVSIILRRPYTWNWCVAISFKLKWSFNDQDSLSQPRPDSASARIFLLSLFYILYMFFLCSFIKTVVNYCYWQSDQKLLHSWNIDILYFGWGWDVCLSLSQCIYVYISWMKQYPAKLPVRIVDYGLY